jgi:hypothetical protein
VCELPLRALRRRQPHAEDRPRSARGGGPHSEWFFFGQFVSLLGSGMSPVALAFAVLNASGGNNKDLALVLAAQTAPILLLPLGGAVADGSRARVLVFAHLVRRARPGLARHSSHLGNYHLGAVMVLAALNGCPSPSPIRRCAASCRNWWTGRALQRANSAQATARNITRIIGPTVGGVLVVTVGGDGRSPSTRSRTWSPRSV